MLRSGAQLLNDSDFQARFRETGQREMDELVRVYNRMADHLREERTRLQEQQFLLGRILAVSPSGIVILDLDGQVDFVNPGAERLLGQPAAALLGRRLDGRRLAAGARSHRPGAGPGPAWSRSGAGGA